MSVRIGGLEDCGLELATARLRGCRPARSPRSSVDLESAGTPAQRAHFVSAGDQFRGRSRACAVNLRMHDA
eukprot:8828662-Alexandrium_andersonii.AAC.1